MIQHSLRSLACIACAVSSTFATNYQLFPSTGTAKSSSATANLHSVVGLPFAGTAKDASSIIYSGYLKMPMVYSMIFNEAPIFTSDTSVIVPVGSKWAYTAQAIDPEQDALTYKYITIPSGFYVSAEDPRVLKTETMSTTDAHVVVVATDAGGLSDTLNLVVTAKKEYAPLQFIASSVATSATEDILYACAVKTSFDGISDPAATFDIRLDVAPSWLSLQKNSSGQYILAGTPLNGAKDTSLILSAYFRNKPDSLAALLNTKVVVTPVNDAPVLTGVNQFSAISGVPFTTTLTATDVDDAVLTFAIAKGPTGATITPAGVLSWTPDTSFVGKVNTISVVVRDPSGAQDVVEYTIAVSPPGVPVCQKVGPVAELVAGTIEIPYVLADATDDPLSFTLSLLRGDTVLATIPSTALIGVTTNILKAGYTGSILWNSSLTLPGVRADSLRIQLTPSDASGAGVPSVSNYFSVNNTASMQVAAVSPVAGSKVTGYEGSTILIAFSGYALDTASFTDKSLVVTGSVSKSFTYTVVSKTATGATIQLNNQPASGEKITVTLAETPLDMSGKKVVLPVGTSAYSWSYNTALLGDFNKDGLIADLPDLATLSTYWHQSANSMLAVPALNAVELAPAYGNAPYFHVTPDATFDYKDLVSFLQMWTWSYNDGTLTRSAESLPFGVKNHITLASTPSSPRNEADTMGTIHDFSVTETDSTCEIAVSVNDVDQVQAGEYRFWFDPTTVSFAGIKKSVSLLELNGGQLFDVVEEGNGYVRIARTRLSKQSLGVSGTGVIVALEFKRSAGSEPIQVQYNLIDQDQNRVDFGSIALSPRSILTPNVPVSKSTSKMEAFPNPASAAIGNSCTELSSDLNRLIERARSNGGVVLTFDRSGFGENAEQVTGSILIRDALGNVVMSEENLEMDLTDSQIYGYYWSGHNNQNRSVANGVYQVLLKWKSKSKSGVAKTVIGIKKENAQ